MCGRYEIIWKGKYARLLFSFLDQNQIIKRPLQYYIINFFSPRGEGGLITTESVYGILNFLLNGIK